MTFVSIWTFHPGVQEKAARAFLKAGGAPLPEGARLISRWHFGDASGGVVIFESDNPLAGYDHAVEWSSMLSMTTRPALTDEQIGPIIAKHYAG
jgi:hypothetical protein